MDFCGQQFDLRLDRFLNQVRIPDETRVFLSRWIYKMLDIFRRGKSVKEK